MVDRVVQIGSFLKLLLPSCHSLWDTGPLEGPASASLTTRIYHGSSAVQMCTPLSSSTSPHDPSSCLLILFQPNWEMVIPFTTFEEEKSNSLGSLEAAGSPPPRSHSALSRHACASPAAGDLHFESGFITLTHPC